MPISINIDETIRKPNVRPPAPVSKRGPITFIAEIEESNGRDLYRNLTRGVNRTDDLPIPVPAPGSRSAALETLLLSLSVSSDFFFPRRLSLGEVVVDLTLPDIEVLSPAVLNLDTISVELVNLIGLNTGVDVTDDEALALAVQAVFAAPTDTGIPLSDIIVDLTVQQIETLATGSQTKTLDTLIADLSSEVGVEVVTDADVSSAFTNEIEVRTDVNAEVASIDLTVQEFEFSVESALDAVVIDLTVDIDTDAFVTVDLSSVIVDLTNTLESEVAVNAEPVSIALSLEEFEVEVEVGGNIDIPGLSLTVPTIEVVATNDLNLATITVDLTVDLDVDASVSKALDTINVDLSLDEAFDNALNLQTLEADFSLTESLDVGINIQLPADMQSAQADDATVVT